MANRAYLLAINNRSITWPARSERAVLAEGIGEIPMFWASLFVSADRQIDCYAGKGGAVALPNWCVATAIANRRLRGLKEPISKLLDDRSRKLWTQWIELIGRQKSQFVKTNALEVWGLDPKGYEAYCRTLLTAFSKPSATTLRAAAKRNGLEYRAKRIAWDNLEVETTLCKLAGAEHIAGLPWFGRRLLDFYARADDDDTRNVFDDIFDEISPDDSLEVARRKAREMLKKTAAKKRQK